MTRSLLLAIALARAAALLDSPGLRGTPISEAAEPAGQYSVRVRGLPGGLLHELLRQVPRRGLRRCLLRGRQRWLRGHEEELLLCYDEWWKRVLDDGDHAAVPRRRRRSRRPKGAVQLLTALARAPATSSRGASSPFLLPLVHSD